MKRLTFILIACLAFASGTSFAASLGRLTVISDLDQPLIAEIDLQGVEVADLPQYSAQLASEQAYRIQGIEKTPPQNSIRVELVRKYDNTPVLKLTSTQPLHSRSTNILVQLDWPSGRVMREYALLLEPSQVANAAPVPIDSVVFTRNRVQPPPSEPAAVAIPPQAPSAPTETGLRPVATEPKPKAAEAPTTAAADGYTTSKGDTLRKIAARMQVDGVTLEQMLQALYLANKEAFIDGDINKLKAGVELQSPSAADFASAMAEPAVTAQAEDWRSYRNNAAQMVKEAPASEAGAETVPQSGKLAKIEDQASRAMQGGRDVLKLSKTDLIDEKWLTREAQFEQEKQALEEEVTVRENRLEDANQRIAELEQQVRDLHLLLEKSRSAAALQAQHDALSFTAHARELLKAPSDAMLLALGVTGLLILILILRVFSGRKSGALQHPLSRS